MFRLSARSAATSFPPFGTTFPGGFFDDPNLLNAAQERIGPFDAAVSPGEAFIIMKIYTAVATSGILGTVLSVQLYY